MSAGRNKSKAKASDDVEFLLKTVDEKNEQVSRLQNKFRDVTHAYRSLLEEKKALEITIKALKTTGNKTSFLNPKLLEVTRSRTDLNASSRTPSVSDLSEIETHSNADSADLEPSKLAANLNDLNQDEKIGALTNHIQLLIDAKSKLERGFQAERKKLRNDHDELKRKLDEMSQAYDVRVKEMKASLKQSQTDREKLTNDLASMVKSKSADQDNKILSMKEENQAILLNLRNENNQLKQKLKNLSKQFENKCEEVVQCGQECSNLKMTHKQQLKDKEESLSDLRDRLEHAQNSSELRIGNLESKINELCTIIAQNESGNNLDESYPKTNYILNKDENQSKEKEPKKSFETPSDFDSAIEQIQTLKNYIETEAKNLNIDFNFNEIWFQADSNLKQEKEENKKLSTKITKLQDENIHLKEEYEKYKIRTNYLIKSAKQASKETIVSNESETQLKKTIQKQKDEIDILNKRMHLADREKIEEIKLLNENFDAEKLTLRNEFKVVLDKVEHDRVKGVNDLEKELVKQRDRTMKLLEEKDMELNKVKGRYKTSPVINITKKSLTRSESDNVDLKTIETFNTSHEEVEEVNELMNSALEQSNEYVNSENNPNIHYSQETAYKDIELNKLRHTKTQLEYFLKQNNDEHTVDIDRFQTQINVLKEEIERLKLNESRDELNRANLEYVKNVVFNFMTTKDNNVKLSMQTALTQILKFTKNERQKLSIVH